MQGASFKDELWVVDLTVPHNGLRRAGLFVVLTRFKDVESILLLRPLWERGDNYKRKKVINAFVKACKLSPDLKAELELQQHNFQRTKASRATQWQRALALAQARAAPAAAAVQPRNHD